MLKKTIPYTDYNGVERIEDCYFNLSKSDLIDMEMSIPGGFSEYLQQIIKSNDVSTLYKVFKDLILKSYGIKSPDGKRFEKSDELSLAFSQTEAYSVMLTELVTDADLASTFVNGIMPQQKPNSLPTAK